MAAGYTWVKDSCVYLGDHRVNVSIFPSPVNLLLVTFLILQQKVCTFQVRSFFFNSASVSEDSLSLGTNWATLLLSMVSQPFTADWTQVRNFYGLPLDNFHQPATAWHRSGYYIFAGSAGGHLYIYHVGSSKVVLSLKVHDKNLRALDYDASENTLVTCSFDRTVKVLQ